MQATFLEGAGRLSIVGGFLRICLAYAAEADMAGRTADLEFGRKATK